MRPRGANNSCFAHCRIELVSARFRVRIPRSFLRSS
jgi:hypothetical protein